MSALEDVLARYPKEEVAAVMPVIWLTAAAAPREQISPKLQQKITQAMRTMGVASATTAEEVALAIAKYCVDKRINAAILLDIASTYQQAQTASILQSAAGQVEEAVKAVGGDTAKSAPVHDPFARAKTSAKPVRGLKK